MNFSLSIVNVCQAEEIHKQLLRYLTRVSGNFRKPNMLKTALNLRNKPKGTDCVVVVML